MSSNRGGKRPGAGRPPGSAGKAHRAFRDKYLTDGGLTPLDFFMTTLRDEFRDFEDRHNAAVAAAPYLHAKVSHTEISGDPEAPLANKVVVEIIDPRARDEAAGSESI